MSDVTIFIHNCRGITPWNV